MVTSDSNPHAVTLMLSAPSINARSNFLLIMHTDFALELSLVTQAVHRCFTYQQLLSVQCSKHASNCGRTSLKNPLQISSQSLHGVLDGPSRLEGTEVGKVRGLVSTSWRKLLVTKNLHKKNQNSSTQLVQFPDGLSLSALNLTALLRTGVKRESKPTLATMGNQWIQFCMPAARNSNPKSQVTRCSSYCT
jgi:hypothetical protein